LAAHHGSMSVERMTAAEVMELRRGDPDMRRSAK
jgi:hypothetical protein